jgi:hypothetical protein
MRWYEWCRAALDIGLTAMFENKLLNIVDSDGTGAGIVVRVMGGNKWIRARPKTADPARLK